MNIKEVMQPLEDGLTDPSMMSQGLDNALDILQDPSGCYTPLLVSDELQDIQRLLYTYKSDLGKGISNQSVVEECLDRLWILSEE